MNNRAEHRLRLAAEAQVARAKVRQTLAEIGRKANARTIVAEIADAAAVRARNTLDQAAASARKRPLLTGAGAAAAVFVLALRTGVAPWRRHETNLGDDRSSSRLETEHDRS